MKISLVNIYKIFLFMMVLGLMAPANLRIFGQEIPQGATDYETSSLNEESANRMQVGHEALNFKDYLPYAKFINYQYQGDGSIFTVQDIIMEYAPDSQGVFQVASFTGDSATAYIYQITDSGLYELACFENYSIVEDLRYSEEAIDGLSSLIIPSKLSPGISYRSGYNKEKLREVIEIIPAFAFGGYSFQNVVKVQEGNNPPYYYYYLAPEYGLILVEQAEDPNLPYQIIQLISTQGNIMQ